MKSQLQTQKKCPEYDLERKIEVTIKQHFLKMDTIPIIVGARQIGKTYIINKTIKSLFKNVVYINFVEDDVKNKIFKNIGSIEEFYFHLSSFSKIKLGNQNDTIIFFDEIQHYPQFLTLLKFFQIDGRYSYICSGSILGVTLFKTTSLPIGYTTIYPMQQLDFEEFLWANHIQKDFISTLKKEYFLKLQSVSQEIHQQLMMLFKQYLLVGGFPQAVKIFLKTNDIKQVRLIHQDIHSFYIDDATKYEQTNKLHIKRIYEMIPSILGNKKKRLEWKQIQGIKGYGFEHYIHEIDYLISSGIVNETKAISNPTYPLVQSMSKNLIKLYLNDVGLLSYIYFNTNIFAILNDDCSINLGSLYETVVASELKSHGCQLFYYDNKKNGEVDFLIDDFSTQSILPVEVKSGRNYQIHHALNTFLANKQYGISKGYVLCNESQIKVINQKIYLPIYFVIFINHNDQ